MLQNDYGGAGAYGFAAAPKLLQNKPKFKDPYGGADEYIPQNIMHDSRVHRGNTHAAMVIPAGTHPDALFLEKKEEQQRKKKIAKKTQQEREEEALAR